MSSIININKEKCIKCGLCIEDCSTNNIKKENDGIKVISDICLFCGHCVAICPQKAIDITTLDNSEIIELGKNRLLIDDSDLLTFFKAKRSIRSYKNKPVEKEKLEEIIEAGRFSSTGGNRQPIRYTVVHNKESIDKLRNMSIETLYNISKNTGSEIKGFSAKTTARYKSMWNDMYNKNISGIDKLFFHAPAVVIVHGNTKINPEPSVDGALAASQMVLMAEALGLGTCYIGFANVAFRENNNILNFLQIPEKNKIVTTFVTGYPNVKYLRTVPRNKPEITWI